MPSELDQWGCDPDETIPAIRTAGIGHVGSRIAQELQQSYCGDVGFDAASRDAPQEEVGAAHLLILLADPEDETVDLAATVERARERGSRGLVAIAPMPPEHDGERMQRAQTVLRTWRPLLQGLYRIPATDNEPAAPHIINAVLSLTTLLNEYSMPCIDLADVRGCLEQPGYGRIVSAECAGEQRAARASQTILETPGIRSGLQRSQGALAVIASGGDMSMDDYYDVVNLIDPLLPENAILCSGVHFNPDIGERLRVTLFVSNCPGVEGE